MSVLLVAEDRGMAIPPGAIVRTQYVPIETIVLACRDRMAVGDVERAMRRRMACAPAQPWPCARGEWRGDRFAVIDGRHDTLAALMLGVEHVLVAWIEMPNGPGGASETPH